MPLCHGESALASVGTIDLDGDGKLCGQPAIEVCEFPDRKSAVIETRYPGAFTTSWSAEGGANPLHEAEALTAAIS
jgi:hypothetical protein